MKTRSAGSWSEHRMVSFDKTPLFYRHLTPENKCRATALILHGNGEHGGRYGEFAEFLAQNGVESWIPDVRGYGQSGGARASLRHFRDYYRDLDGIYSQICRVSGDARLFLVGHSNGGLTLASWLAATPELRCRGLVLSSPNFGIAIQVPRWQHLAAMLGAYVLPDLTLSNRVDTTKLTHDTRLLQLSKKDRLIHLRVSLGLYRELTHELTRVDAIAACIHCPALVLQAGQDHIVSRAATVRFFEQLRSTDKELKIYEDLYHELLNETERPAIYARIGGWMEQRL